MRRAGPMLIYLAKRVGMSVIIIYIVITLSFFMIRLMPGNPMAALEAKLRMQGGVPEAEIQQRVATVYGVTPDDPVFKQYVDYVLGVFTGNLGIPITNPGTTVVQVIASSLPWTVLVVAISLLISFVIGIAIGAAMAAFKDGWFSKIMTFVVSFLSAVPNYLVAILLLYTMAGIWNIFPAGGAYSVDVVPGWSFGFIGSVLYHAFLPILATVITSFGGWALGMKGSAISVLGSEYVRAAESRGLSPRRVTQSYVGRNSMLPMVTQLALSVGFMFGGSVFIETFFQYPGIGFYMIQSVNERDYSLMMGCFLLITVTVIITNLLVDVLYPLIDPRIASPAARRAVEDDAHGDGADDVIPVGGSVA